MLYCSATITTLGVASGGVEETKEEMIVDDLVTDQIVSRMAFESVNDENESTTGITDEEIDVLLAAVVSNESL